MLRQLLATFPVTSTADSGPGTLRAQIPAANAAGGSNTIEVPADTYTLTSSALDITSNMTVSGAGAGATFIQGSHEDCLTVVLTCVQAIRRGHYALWKDAVVGTRLAQLDPSLETKPKRRRNKGQPDCAPQE
jgi:hypothetical protein